MTSGMEKAVHLRAQLAAGRALMERYDSLDRVADALLSTPDRSQRWADIRERWVQGVAFDEEDAMEYLEEQSIDIESIAWEEATSEPELPRIQGKLGRIFELARQGEICVADCGYRGAL